MRRWPVKVNKNPCQRLLPKKVTPCVINLHQNNGLCVGECRGAVKRAGIYTSTHLQIYAFTHFPEANASTGGGNEAIMA
jgi:hypothetical protein